MIGTLINLSKVDFDEFRYLLKERMNNAFEILYEDSTTVPEAKKEFDSWLEAKILNQLDAKFCQDIWTNFAWHLEHERGLTP
jgi:uncharacterized protein with ParB-like and HNH nuclease domain